MIKFADFIKKVPVISGLGYANPLKMLEALWEFLFVWLISLLPIFANILIELIGGSSPATWETVWQIVRTSFVAGDILIYSSALLAPVAFLFYEFDRANAKFFCTRSFQILLIFIIAASAIIYGCQKAGKIKNQDLAWSSSMTIYCCSLVLWYLSIVYRYLIPDFSKIQKAEVEKLNEALIGYHGEPE